MDNARTVTEAYYRTVMKKQMRGNNPVRKQKLLVKLFSRRKASRPHY